MKTKSIVNKILIGSGLLLILMWGASGFFNTKPYFEAIIGITLGVILLLYSGVMTYFKDSKYKKIDLDDLKTLVLVIVGTIILLSGAVGFKYIDTNLPFVVKNLVDSTKVITALVGSVILLAELYWGKD